MKVLTDDSRRDEKKAHPRQLLERRGTCGDAWTPKVGDRTVDPLHEDLEPASTRTTIRPGTHRSQILSVAPASRILGGGQVLDASGPAAEQAWDGGVEPGTV